MVIMFRASLLFRWLIIAANVVDLPVPVLPVTRTKPLGFSASDLQIAGRPNSSIVGTSNGTRRMARLMVPRCTNALILKRAKPRMLYAKSSSSSLRKLCFWFSLVTCSKASFRSGGVTWGMPSITLRTPSIRRMGGLMTLRCRSEAPLSTIRRSSSSIFMIKSLRCVAE